MMDQPNGLGNGQADGHRNGNGGFSWRAAKQYLQVDDGAGTESEAESSYQGWSDNGWRTSPASTRPRASLSSSDEQHSNLSIEPTQNGTLRDGSFPFPSSSLSQLTTVPQRRQTISRPGLHSAAPSISVERPTISTDRPSAVLDVDTDSPVSLGPSPLSNGIEQHQSYPRARRKSLSHSTATALLTKLDDEPLLNGSPHGKGKKKRFRAASFSLPTHRRRRLSNASYWRWWSRKVPRPVKQWFLVLLIPLALIYGILLWRRKYELQIEFSVFSHKWIRREVDLIQPLRGCFDPHNVSPEYNISLHTGPKRQLLTPGVAIRRGMSCYDFASTVQSFHDVPLEPLTYHTYWRSDLIPFGERHTATLLSFLATQPLSQSKLVLWSNGADLVANNYFVRPFLEKWGDNIEVRQVDMNALTRGTELDGLLSGIDGGGLFDERAWVDGDAVRLLVLWHFGGVWLDMDQILTRDLHPLTESEFVTQWDCYDKAYFTLNGALMHFRKHSPYLCEAFHIMASSPLPRPNTFTWGAHLYSKLHRRLLAGRQRPFAVLPWCFSDPRNCRSDIRFPDPFASDPDNWAGRRWDGRGEVGRSGRELLEEKVGYVWTVHLHNQWRKVFPPGGWMCRLLEGYKGQLEVMERYRQGERERGEVGGNGRVQVVEEVGVLTKRRLADEVEGEGEGSGDAEEVDNELVGDEEEVRGEGSEV